MLRTEPEWKIGYVPIICYYLSSGLRLLAVDVPCPLGRMSLRQHPVSRYARGAINRVRPYYSPWPFIRTAALSASAWTLAQEIRGSDSVDRNRRRVRGQLIRMHPRMGSPWVRPDEAGQRPASYGRHLLSQQQVKSTSASHTESDVIAVTRPHTAAAGGKVPTPVGTTNAGGTIVPATAPDKMIADVLEWRWIARV